ncbi:hypothetical protein B0H15DRAFT_940316 [Mycena belliarum]|uniref:6-phosphogluconate dehydrogenase n=1 Tax=Mycena belliarum TaxID=1033014 RepID=A0AAD6XJA0_9AGAR|nr:hypothetical protein B0H15DRAFT_940316 [Mycena belliae]
MPTHTIALLAPGGMGSKIAARLSSCGGGTVLTNLEGRSAATVQRAKEAGMEHASYAEIAARATCVLSVVPPKDAFAVAEALAGACKAAGPERALTFVDCNAVNPDSVKRMAALFEGTAVHFIDGAIVGAPPSDTYNPGIYVSSDGKDAGALDEFVSMAKGFGLNVFPLKGADAGVGDASALKMAHAGIVKGATGLFVTMILAAHSTSPSTAEGLLHALNLSQPAFVDLIIRMIPQMIPKAYRFIKEMDEIVGFVGAEEGKTFEGLEKVFGRVATAHEGAGPDIAVLMNFVEQARETWDATTSTVLYRN